jgi:hypothetical protein
MVLSETRGLSLFRIVGERPWVGYETGCPRRSFVPDNQVVELYNQGRPHASLGPGVFDSPEKLAQKRPNRYCLSTGYRIVTKPVLGGLHYEYRLEKVAA